MNRNLAFILISSGIALIGLGIAFFLQLDFVRYVWPWQIIPLSAVFLASICAATAAPIIWIGLMRETAAMAGGAINLIVTGAGMAIFCLQLYAADTSRQQILLFGTVAAVLALSWMGLFLISYKKPFLDSRSTPTMVRFSFLIFSVTLFLTGGALLLKVPNVFPWTISPEISVMYGWFFWGALGYFFYGFLIPKWANAQGQLLSFLGYDLVLILPFLLHFAIVEDEQRLSLIIYVTVLVTSGILAIFFLFVHKETRFGSVAQA